AFDFILKEGLIPPNQLANQTPLFLPISSNRLRCTLIASSFLLNIFIRSARSRSSSTSCSSQANHFPSGVCVMNHFTSSTSATLMVFVQTLQGTGNQRL